MQLLGAVSGQAENKLLLNSVKLMICNLLSGKDLSDSQREEKGGLVQQTAVIPVSCWLSFAQQSCSAWGNRDVGMQGCRGVRLLPPAASETAVPGLTAEQYITVRLGAVVSGVL